MGGFFSPTDRACEPLLRHLLARECHDVVGQSFHGSKQTERLQEVPVAVSVITPAATEGIGVLTPLNLSQSAPGLRSKGAAGLAIV